MQCTEWVQKMAENIYFECRKKAALHNDALNSRAGAAKFLGVSESSLTQYELGLTKAVPVDTVVMMAEAYGMPILKANYCKHECPIGRDLPIAVSAGTIEGVTVRLLNSLNRETLESARRDILKIAADGKIDRSEQQRLKEILGNLERISVAVSELRMCAEEALNDGRR